MCSLVGASSDAGIVSPALVDLSWKLKSCELIAGDHDAHGFPWRREFWSTLQHFLICLHSQQQADNAAAASCFSLLSAKHAEPTQLNPFYRLARWKIKATSDFTGNWDLHYSQTSQALLQWPVPQKRACFYTALLLKTINLPRLLNGQESAAKTRALLLLCVNLFYYYSLQNAQFLILVRSLNKRVSKSKFV